MAIEIMPGSASVAARDVQVFCSSTDAEFRITPELGKLTKLDNRSYVYRAPFVLRSRTVVLTAEAEGERSAAVLTISATPFWMAILSAFWAVLAVSLVAALFVIWPPPVEAPRVEVHPPLITVPAGGSAQFSAKVWNVDNSDVTWNAPGAVITPTGLLTVPAAPTATTLLVTASRKSDASQAGTALVQLVPAGKPGLALSPSMREIGPAESAQLSPAPGGAGISSWTCAGPNGESCGSGGATDPIRFTPPAAAESARRYVVTAVGAGGERASALVYQADKTSAGSTALLRRLHQDKVLIALALLMGAFGATLGASRSFVNFVGNRQFIPSWGLYYLSRPPLGSGLALLVFLGYRIGQIPAPDGYSSADPAAVAFVAGLVGLSVDPVLGKLHELIAVLLPSRESRSEPLTTGNTRQTVATGNAGQTANPGSSGQTVTTGNAGLTVTAATGTRAGGRLVILGTGFTASTKVLIGGKSRTATFVNSTQLAVDLDASDQAGPISVTVSEGQNTVTFDKGDIR